MRDFQGSKQLAYMMRVGSNLYLLKSHHNYINVLISLGRGQ